MPSSFEVATVRWPVFGKLHAANHTGEQEVLTKTINGLQQEHEGGLRRPSRDK